jgi:methanogenic corrinoid protein MtbC1
VPALRVVVLPALASIGDAWEREQIGVGHEHMATHLVERRLLGLSAGWDEGPGPLALLACPSGERHTLGLLAFGIALAERGWRISYLGADTPLSQVHGAAQRLAPALVVLCALAAAPLHDRRGLAGVAASHRTLIGGAGATPALARAAGCEHLAGDPIGAARAVAA